MDQTADIFLDRGWAMWMAAMVDGEGCILVRLDNRKSLPCYQTMVSVAGTAPVLMDKVLEVAGCGKLQNTVKSWGDKARPGRHWHVTGRDAFVFLGRVTPFLVLKKRQGLLAQALMVSQRDQNGKFYTSHNPRPEAVVAYQAGLYRAMRGLNAKGGTEYDGRELDALTLEALLGGPDAYAQHLDRSGGPLSIS